MSSQHFYMLGRPVRGYSEDKLPTLSEVLRNFLIIHGVKKDVQKSALKTCADVISLFEKKGIPTQSIYKAAIKLKTHYVEWQVLKKHRSTTDKGFGRRRSEFMSLLTKEFDIRAQEAPISARKVKSVVQVPSVVQITPSHTLKRKRSAFQNAIDNISNKRSRLDSVISDRTTSSGTEIPHSDADNPVKKIDFIDDNIVKNCDGVGLTSWQAIKIISAVAQALGHNLNNLKISHSTRSLA